ncbi:MAG: ornithine cyclodeaminase [Thermoplasmataceae archaeon]
MYYITEEDVRSNLGMKETIEAMEVAFTEYGKGTAATSPRDRLIIGGVVYNTMPGVIEKYHLAGLKTYIASKEGARFVVAVFDTRSMDLVAVIEANRLGQVRTGALPAMVTSRIVKARNPDICIVGSGFQAETQLEALLAIYDPENIYVYSRNFGNAGSFAERMSRAHGINVIPVKNVAEGTRKARIINTITNSNEAIFSRKDLGQEYHVNLCGGNLPNRREAAEDVLTGSELVIAENLDQALKESGEIIGFHKNHPERQITELKDFVIARDGNFSRSAFKSMGIGLEDVAAAYVVLKNMSLID